MNILVYLLSSLTIATAAEYIKCTMPVDQHNDLELPIKSCGKGEPLIFQLNDLPVGKWIEFRTGHVSAEIPIVMDMELMTEAGLNSGMAKKILDSVKKVLGGADGPAVDGDMIQDVQVFKNVEKISFKASESTMYVRVTAEFTGVARPDKAEDPATTCGPARVSFLVERLYFGYLPTTTAILFGSCGGVLLFFWLIGMPLLGYLLGPQLVEQTKKGEEETKKNK